MGVVTKLFSKGMCDDSETRDDLDETWKLETGCGCGGGRCGSCGIFGERGGCAAGVGGPPWARGGQGPRPFMLFQIFDADEDGALTEDEVPAPVWSRLSAADLDGDGAVTREEIMAHLQKSGGGRPGRQSRPQAEQPKK